MENYQPVIENGSYIFQDDNILMQNMQNKDMFHVKCTEELIKMYNLNVRLEIATPEPMITEISSPSSISFQGIDNNKLPPSISHTSSGISSVPSNSHTSSVIDSLPSNSHNSPIIESPPNDNVLPNDGLVAPPPNNNGLPNDGLETLPSTSTNTSNNNRASWSHDQIMLLLKAYEDNKAHFEGTTYKSKQCLEFVANELADKMILYNFSYTSTQCYDKFKNLKKDYHAWKDSQRQTGAEAKSFDYAEQFQKLFAKHHSVDPPCISSSFDVQMIVPDDNSGLMDVEGEGEDEEFQGDGARQKRGKNKRGQQELLREYLEQSAEDKKERFEKLYELQKSQVETQQKFMESFVESNATFANLLGKLIDRSGPQPQ